MGLTCRQDVVEMLEKRVKSRFRYESFRCGWVEGAASIFSVGGMGVGGRSGSA